jgi:quercetin 2,3-dioxygenase
MHIVRAEQRYRSAQDGIESWHCFSAGAYYDPANVSYGAVVGCDEHVVSPGSGFEWHGHRGVDIVSWVLAGALRHESGEQDLLVPADEVLRQSAAQGVRHRETNGSDLPLHFVQMTVLAGRGASFEVRRSDVVDQSAWWHVFVAAGSWQFAGERLDAGDSARGAGELAATGSGALLVWKS